MARKDRDRKRDDDESTPFFTRISRWLMLLAALGLLWLGGGIAYIERVESLPAPDETRTDAIVVLTGGAARLATALRLLNENKADRLLVSGVAQTATKASLMQAVLPAMPDAAQASGNWQGIDLQLLFDCCVDLGFEAEDTAGNAAETASWAAARGYKTIRLVTANYHMPRAQVEFGRYLPGFTMLPHPVRSDAMRVEDWWQRRAATAFLLGEYTKYVAALLRAHLGSQLSATLAQKPVTSAPQSVPVEKAPAPEQPQAQPADKPDEKPQ
jgi:uncharacterized SAM-binding protein YcdF (DUF218 family)